MNREARILLADLLGMWMREAFFNTTESTTIIFRHAPEYFPVAFWSRFFVAEFIFDD